MQKVTLGRVASNDIRVKLGMSDWKGTTEQKKDLLVGHQNMLTAPLQRVKISQWGHLLAVGGNP